MKYLQIILLLTIFVGCVTTPNEPRINSPAKTLASLGEGEKIAFVNLLTNNFYYSPRVNGPFDRREISYNQSVISMHSESFNAWEEVTRSFIDAPLVDLTEEFLNHNEALKKRSLRKTLGNLSHQRRDIRFVVPR